METLAEREIAAFDRVHEDGAVHRLRRGVHKCGVTLELGKLEPRPERFDHRGHEVRQDVVGVLQLDAGQILRVSGDVGDDQAGPGGVGHLR